MKIEEAKHKESIDNIIEQQKRIKDAIDKEKQRILEEEEELNKK